MSPSKNQNDIHEGGLKINTQHVFNLSLIISYSIGSNILPKCSPLDIKSSQYAFVVVS